MSYEQSVIDEIAARYGVPVTGTVQIVPKGESGIFTEFPVWNGRELVYPSLKGETGQALREAQKRARDNYARQQRFERATKKAAESKPKPPTLSELYGGRIRFLAGEGKTGAEIAAEINLAVETVRNVASHLRISIPRAKRGPAPKVKVAAIGCNPKQIGPAPHVQARRERLAQMLTDGMSHAEAFAALGMSRKVFSRDIAAIGVKPVVIRATQGNQTHAAKIKARNRAIGEMFLTGMTYAAIVEATGLGISTVKKAVAWAAPNRERPEIKSKVHAERMARYAERRQQIANMLKSGMTYRQIKKITGASPATIATASALIEARA